MVITIEEDSKRFNACVRTLIFNENMTKILMQRQGKHDFYMFPGGRLDFNEDIQTAIKRELIEELGITSQLTLKYFLEAFLTFPNKTRYHELGFYFITKISETKTGYLDNKEYDSLDEIHDGKSKFKWIKLNEIDNYKFLMENFKKIIKKGIEFNDKVEHLIFKD